MSCRFQALVNRPWAGGGVSHESEHDLAVMVEEFWEDGNSVGNESRCSSDSDSGLADLPHLSERISYLKLATDESETALSSLVNSLILSMDEKDLHSPPKSSPCNSGCIRFRLVKLMRLSGYDAGVCTSKWPGRGNVPGGDHEYIDVVMRWNDGEKRVIVDVDFRSHFEIARAVESYDGILNSLPVTFVGCCRKLKEFLEVMAEAGRCSLRLNSMTLPPWRSLAYLQAKWDSAYTRRTAPPEEAYGRIAAGKCGGCLKRIQCQMTEKKRAASATVKRSRYYFH